MSDVGAQVSYRVSVSDPARHLVDVEMRITGAAALGDAFELSMAAWCPGSYLVRDYARFLRGVTAADGDGNALSCTKTSKHNWRVAGASEVVVRYQVYGYELTVRTNHIDETHAFLHGPATYLWIDSLRHQPSRVTIEVPQGWDIATGLEPDGDGGYLAADLDQLLDCPLHLGVVVSRSFEVAGKPMRFVVWGAAPGGAHADFDQLIADVTSIVEAHATRFGGVPYNHYTFVLMLAPRAYGGLEHCNSSANLHNPFAFDTEKEYLGLLELLSHEFFHVWNGKRLYPEAFSPFDYSKENYTRKLWVMEGLTSYYDRYTVRAADKIPVKRYFEKLCEEWGRMRAIPGRNLQSLEESSFDAWIKLYKPDASNVNTTVSYYLKGGLVAMAMDLEIRRRTEGAHSLDDVLARLWSEYGAQGKPYPEGDVQSDFEAACGVSLGELFQRCIHGRQDPDLAGELAHLGLELRGTHDTKGEPDGSNNTPIWIGVSCRGSSATLAGVLDGGPAASAGLSPSDEIVAIDGYKVSGESELRKRLATAEPGQAVEVALFRRGRLRTVTLTPGEAPPTRYEIVGVDEPTEAQKARYLDWMGAEHPGPGVVAGATVPRIL